MRKILLLLISVIFLNNGCATTDDPREGGLLGYIVHGEEAYRERLGERKEKLEIEKEKLRIAKENSLQLERKRRAKYIEISRQTKMLVELDKDLNNINQSISNIKAENSLKDEEKKQVHKKLKELSGKINKIRLDTKLSVEERKAKIQILDKEVTALMEIAASL